MSRISSHVYYVWKKRVYLSWNDNFFNITYSKLNQSMCYISFKHKPYQYQEHSAKLS